MADDLSQREAVARAIHQALASDWMTVMGALNGDQGQYERLVTDLADAALAALAPVQPTVECDTCHGSGVLGDDTCPGGCDRGARLAPVQPTDAAALLRGEIEHVEQNIETYRRAGRGTDWSALTARLSAFRRALHIVEHAQPVQPDPLRAGLEALADELPCAEGWHQAEEDTIRLVQRWLRRRVAALLAETEVPRGE